MSEGEYLTGSSYRLLDFIEDYATSAGNGLYWNYNEGIGHFLSIEPGESVTVGFEDSPASAEIIYCLSAGYNDYTATTTRYPMGEPVYSRYAFIINDPVAGFIDVSASAYYADAVVWAVDNNVTDGVSKTKFAPSNTVSRAEAVTFLWRAYGRPEPTSTTSKFKDVTDTSAYYYKAVLWAAENGITTGVSDTWFDLKATLTFEQILTFLCRAAGGDASGDDWSNKALTWAKNNGVTGALSFSATDKCPRSDVVYCLYNQLAK
jgi:hypothetical protein